MVDTNTQIYLLGKGIHLELRVKLLIEWKENGITEPITIKNSYRFEKKGPTKRKTFYILSDSMMNGMDENRLSNNNIEVKVECHGGCMIEHMFTHVDMMVKYKPDCSFTCRHKQLYKYHV